MKKELPKKKRKMTKVKSVVEEFNSAQLSNQEKNLRNHQNQINIVHRKDRLEINLIRRQNLLIQLHIISNHKTNKFGKNKWNLKIWRKGKTNKESLHPLKFN